MGVSLRTAHLSVQRHNGKLEAEVLSQQRVVTDACIGCKQLLRQLYELCLWDREVLHSQGNTSLISQTQGH